MKRKNLIISIIPIILLAFSSCFPSLVNSSSNKQSYNRNPFIYKLHPEFRFYHSTSGNKLHVRLNLQEIMFAQLRENEQLKAKVKIMYFVYSPDNFETPVDSADFNFDLSKQAKQTSAITYIPVKEVGMKQYYLKIFTIDMLKNIGSKDFIYVDYENENSSQNFLSTYDKTNITYFRPYLKIGQTIDIKHNTPIDTLFIRFMYHDFETPPPPYSTTPYLEPVFEYDSLYFVTGVSKLKFKADKKAFYCIQTDTTNKNGVYIMCESKDFPFVRSSQAMLNSLQYICRNKEFRDLQNVSNKKLALDRFWLKCGGNMNRARELIRIYYNRVLYSNVYFSSYKQGWKTDRGMIYIMFGTPNKIKKEINKEIWIYSDRREEKMLKFVFNKQNSPYSDNVFVLERSGDFMQFWAEAKKSWRAGKIYILFR